MDKNEEVEQSIENEIERYEHYIEMVRQHADMVPYVQERKKEAEAKLILVRNTPHEIFSEFVPRIFDNQLFDEETAKNYIPIIPPVIPEFRNIISSGSVSASAYVETFTRMTKIVKENEEKEWMKPIANAFTRLSEEKSRKASIPEKLDRLSPELGKAFSIANLSLEKARAGILGIDQAAIQLRDVLQRLWGEVANIARVNGPRKYRDIRLELSKEKSKQIVVECLGKDERMAKEITSLLFGMHSIHSDISDREFGKNPLTTDRGKLDNIYTRWILVIDGVLGFLDRFYS